MIKKYIEFGTDNGYKEKRVDGEMVLTEAFAACWDDDIIKYKLYLSVITSKEFISAVARGIEGKGMPVGVEPSEEDWSRLYERIQYITTQQAIAIRDNTLDTFINSLLDNK